MGRQDIDKKMFEAAEDLSKTVTELAGMGVKHSSLQKAIKSLEVAVKTLGKIKVVFDNTRVFWIGVEKNCKEIVENADTLKILAGVDDDMAIETIAESALNWFVLGKVSYTAKHAISEMDKKMDKIQSNLPNEAEAQKMIPDLSKKMEMVCAENEGSDRKSKCKVNLFMYNIGLSILLLFEYCMFCHVVYFDFYKNRGCVSLK